jgi:hypothetical protein
LYRGFVVPGLLLAWSCSVTLAEDTERQQAKQWFYGDEEEKALAVNEGELNFISPPADKAILHSDSILSINRQSLEDGWVRLEQCYHGLDPVPQTAIVYHYQEIDKLQLLSARNIGAIELGPGAVELKNVARNASLCVAARVRLLESVNGGYRLRNGPYHRQFLDGYYPFHVSLRIVYPAGLLRAETISPQRQPGFEVRSSDHGLYIDSWFEGRLTVDVVFSVPAQKILRQ